MMRRSHLHLGKRGDVQQCGDGCSHVLHDKSDDKSCLGMRCDRVTLDGRLRFYERSRCGERG
jgi:hypothetical protein